MHPGFIISVSAGLRRQGGSLRLPIDNIQPSGAVKSKANKVLIVDDEVDMAELASLLLSGHGFETVVAYSASVALDLLKTDPGIDAVFSDVMMPGMSGIELAQILDKLYPTR